MFSFPSAVFTNYILSTGVALSALGPRRTIIRRAATDYSKHVQNGQMFLDSFVWSYLFFRPGNFESEETIT